MKIRRRCKCGCGRITNPGRKWVKGHNFIGNIYCKGKKDSKETRKKRSISQMGNTNAIGNTNTLGYRHSKDSKIKQSISQIKYDPNDPYCDIWKDGEYKRDLRKDYCENIDCKGNYKRLNNHHIDLDKKNCHPSNIMTLCASCHSILHNKLRDGKCEVVNSRDFLIINRKDHVSYINKKTRIKITVLRR